MTTWGELKAAVEAKGVTDETPLTYIDLRSLECAGPVEVCVGKCDDGTTYIDN